MEAAAAHMLNFSQPFDCELLDQIVSIAMDGSHPQRSAANEFLVRMKDHPDMWKRADAILEASKKEETKYFGLQVLTEAINTHWKVIPEDDRFGIRSYIITKIVGLASSDESMKRNHAFLNHLNIVLVQILKQDWPHNWPTFITDLVESSKTSESLCENNMRILLLLSEDVFEFSKESLTAAKMKAMKETLNDEFSKIFQLCEFVLSASTKPTLILATLQTLQRFLSWIALAFIFETQLVNVLIANFLPNPVYRTATLDCLIEVASLQPTEMPESYRSAVQHFFVHFVRVLQTIIPINVDLRAAYDNGSPEEQLFVSRLALFLGTFLKSFLMFFEQVDGSVLHESSVQEALIYMVHISEVDDEEIFKTCLEFWYHFAKDLFTADSNLKIAAGGGVGNSNTNHLNNNNVFNFGNNNNNNISNHNSNSINSSSSHSNHTLYPGGGRPKHQQYESSVLHPLRIVMIDRMAKPEEVIIVEDENGEIVREQTKDTEVIAQYKTMKEALVYLTHLNYEDTESIMLEKLDLQVAGGMFTWNGLNTLCWAIGSISGAMGELDEKRFLVSVIKDLLRLCEEQRGKDNKAVVASNIMYIVGQYPRFLRAHWKFLKTVVNKLFEFMHEHHPGVQDMACDTFLKIAQKCKRKFMTPQQDDPQPFILTLIADLPRHTMDLLPHQTQSFYESVGTMLSDQGPAIFLAREQVMFRLMESTNAIWQNHMAQAAATSATSLLDSDTLRELSRILRLNAKVCSATGAVYLHQLGMVFRDMLNVYRFAGEQVVAAVAAQGPIAVRHAQVKLLRNVKSDVLEVFTAAVEVCAENRDQGATGHEVFLTSFLPGILDEILADYRVSPPAARDAKVLSFFAAAIGTLRDLISKDVPRIMEGLFEKTLEIITKNMEDHPEHRAAFFTFLRQANAHCFYGLFAIPAPHQKLVVESIIWAVKHTERNISETGLEILLELLQNVASNAHVAQSFYDSFLVSLVQDIFGVLTDRLHKSGFKLQASVLKHLCHLTQAGQVLAPLQLSSNNNNVNNSTMDNATFLKEHISQLLLDAFPNLGRAVIVSFVRGLFDLSMDLVAFKQHLRDFLIAVKEFATEDNTELYSEELEFEREAVLRAQEAYVASVPGLRRPQDIDFDPDL